MEPTTQEQALDRLPGKAKSIRLAYFIWVLAGAIGGHRFYLGKIASGVIMLLLFMVGLMTLSAGVGAVILAAVWFWALVDAVLIPGMIQGQGDRLSRGFWPGSIHSADGSSAVTSTPRNGGTRTASAICSRMNFHADSA